MNQFEYKGIKTDAGKKILKVNILPEKRCNFDCIFCPLGRSRERGDAPFPYPDIQPALEDLEGQIELHRPDIVSLNSSGEALLHGGIRDIITHIHKAGCAVRLCTNGYLLGKEPFAGIASGCEEVFAEIKTLREPDFQKAQRPVPGYTLKEYVGGMERFRRQYKGRFIFEVTLIRGYNDDGTSVEKLKGIIRRLSPDLLRVSRMDREPFCRKLGIDDGRFEQISAELYSVL